MGSNQYSEISRGATSCLLLCIRIIDEHKHLYPASVKEEARHELSELGVYLENALTHGVDKNIGIDQLYIARLLTGVDGLALAIEIEDDILKGKNPGYRKWTEELTKHGITSLDELAKALKNAETPKFDEYARALASLFDEWRKYADEGCVMIPRAVKSVTIEDIGKVVERFPSKP
jgi:hypothetical protein